MGGRIFFFGGFVGMAFGFFGFFWVYGLLERFEKVRV
jgi:hypothetical protein